jgi:hypothetical protein
MLDTSRKTNVFRYKKDSLAPLLLAYILSPTLETHSGFRSMNTHILDFNNLLINLSFNKYESGNV